MISIIVPVYNVKDYIVRCLNSLVNQTFKEIEIIVVDDGSTDGSAELVDEYVQSQPSIKVIHKQNGGLMSAWTTGVRASSGEYIGFIDSDDYVEMDMYEKMYNIAKSTNADVVMCDFRVEGTNNCSSIGIDSGLYDGEKMHFIKSHIFPQESSIIISNSRCNKLFKRDLILSNLKYTRSLSRTFEDRYIVPAAIMSANSFYYLKEPFYIYTLDRVGCNSNKYKPDLIEDIIRMYNTQKEMLEDKGLMETYGIHWEKSFLNCIRVYIGRNILGVKGFGKRYQSAKKLLSNAIVQDRLKKYGKEMKGKTGIAVQLSFRLNSPLILSLLSYLVR